MIKQRIIKSERIQYSDICPECNDEISGFSIESQKLNMKSHLEKHEREKIKLEDKPKQPSIAERTHDALSTKGETQGEKNDGR